MDVDITEIKCTDTLISKIKIKTEDPDATEASSSFGDTLSAKDNCSDTTDTEVDSSLYGMPIHNFGNSFPGRKKKKKKVTAHWKNFIRPLMWRSKWAELKIIELQKQARKYDRQLAAYEDKKKLLINHQHQKSSPHFASKLSPFNLAARRKTGMTITMTMMMRRRRRRRVEDVTDIKSYFSKHNLFSYHERDKSNVDSTSVAEETEKKNLGEGEIMKREDDVDDDDDDCRLLFPESEESNDPLEQFMRKILNVKSHVQKLKSQLVSVISGNGSKLSSRENLGILSQRDAQSSSEDMSGCEGETNSKGMILFDSKLQQLQMSDYDDDDDDDMGDFVMGRGEVSSYNIVVPDIIESNVSKLSSEDVTMHQLPQSGDSCEAIMDNGHIHNGLLALEEESLKMESGQEESSSNNSGSVAAAVAATKYDNDEDQQLELELDLVRTNTGPQTHTPLSKGKRAKRRAGSAGWKNRLL